jgi:hypothetical protein
MNYDTLLSNFDELNAQIKRAKQEMQDKSKGLIEEAAKRFLDACPEVTGVHWTQYTPYFNDGESCEFSVNEMCFHILEDEDDEVEAYESSEIYTAKDLENAKEKLKVAEEYTANPTAWREQYVKEYEMKLGRPYGNGINHLRPYPSDPTVAQERIDEIQRNLETYGPDVADRINLEFSKFTGAMKRIPDDIMLSVYGDHAFVIINRDGTEIDEYEHD